MQFVSFEDETALFEAVVFPPVYRKIGDLLEDPCPCRITGTWEDDQGAPIFHLDDVISKSTRLRTSTRGSSSARLSSSARAPIGTSV
jgi:DNA polymerase-3 subunit alpha/error-prone DNA polymerase